MKLTVDDYYNLVSDLLRKNEFIDRIEKYEEKYTGLLDKDVIAHLIVDELGRNITKFSLLSDLKAGGRGSLFCTVIEPEPKLFSKKNDNRAGAIVNISDITRSARLVLWDPEQVVLVENKTIQIGTKLKLINAKITKSSNGLDLTPERFESLIIDPVDYPDPAEEVKSLEITDIEFVVDDGPVNVIGTVSSMNQLRTFTRKNQTTGHVMNIELYDGTGSIRITLWDDHAKAAEEYSIGDQLKIINGYSKLHNNVREIQTNYQTKIIKDNKN
jgi:ssDNA-binding replication factor A large subunit